MDLGVGFFRVFPHREHTQPMIELGCKIKGKIMRLEDFSN
jgi:hypothetical protein